MSSLFSSCFGRRSGSAPLPDTDSDVPAGRRAVDSVNPAKCAFCNVTPDRFKIILEDAELICFRDRSPAAAVHLQVIPRTHIANVQSLGPHDTDLVRRMHAFGTRALDLLQSQVQSQKGGLDGASKGSTPVERRFGFHIPPFRSVDHLHMHCLELPFSNSLRALKYRVAKPPSPSYFKGWSWFAEYEQTCALLSAGRKHYAEIAGIADSNTRDGRICVGCKVSVEDQQSDTLSLGSPDRVDLEAF
ncbi:HIT-like protein [Moesziomyces antarcticus]|uniref:HIT-like protein n=1 Tax=Pseudozyma antarctica TaxID=84753 RepID=A0A081CGA7_PSEA2|nr:HIT-like protein [Moesziomyces antarcticus]GAK65703.1 HIT-like protein [Moesziomyces antarcticus]